MPGIRRPSRSRAGLWLAVALPVLALAGAGTCSAQQPGDAAAPAHRRWVGLRYPPLPEGVRVNGASTIGAADTARFALEHVTAGGVQLLWLVQEVARVDRRPVWRVRDVVELPPRDSGRWLSLALCGVPRGGARHPAEPEDIALDPRIAAIVRVDTAAVWTTVERAWRADLHAGRFMPIDTAGVVCLNELDSEG